MSWPKSKQPNSQLPTGQLLISKDAYERISDRIDEVASKVAEGGLEIALWEPSGQVSGLEGEPASNTAFEFRPDAVMISLDVLMGGHLSNFADAALQAGTLRWAQACLAGTDMEPFQRIAASGAVLTRSDVPNASVGEYVLSAVLHVFHEWNERVDNQQSRHWQQAQWREIAGTRWLVVGFGSLGGEVAKRARPFGVTVVGARRTAVQVRDTALDAGSADEMVTMDRLHEELSKADVVVMACPLTDDTRGLVDAEFLAAMRPEAMLVNVARGPVVDTAALLAALDAGHLSHAILDVFETEPLPTDSELWNHKQVTVTSHIAGAGSGMRDRNDDLFLEQLEAYLSGQPLRLVVRDD